MQPQWKILSVIVIVVAALSIGSLAFARSSNSPTPDAPPAPDSDSNPTHLPEVVIPEHYRPSASDLASAAATGTSTVYFTPQDENTSTTVLFLYNTNNVTSTVGLQTFYINGSLTISTTVAVPPLGLVRICADTVNTISASWANYVLVNFTTFSAYAKMVVPTGVHTEAYVAWDYAGFYDPISQTLTLPIRFSTDPATVFLPTVQR